VGRPLGDAVCPLGGVVCMRDKIKHILVSNFTYHLVPVLAANCRQHILSPAKLENCAVN
jgi:hypothetical protein